LTNTRALPGAETHCALMMKQQLCAGACMCVCAIHTFLHIPLAVTIIPLIHSNTHRESP